MAQFGGLINFKLKTAELNSPLSLKLEILLEVINYLLISLQFLSQKRILKFYSFVNIKRGNGFRIFQNLNLEISLLI